MRFSARVLIRCLAFLLISAFLLPVFALPVSAQTTQPADVSSLQYMEPNLDTGVPTNQHNYVQSLFIETILAIQCQLIGIDFSDLSKSCLGINLENHTLSYAPTTPNGNPPLGGVIGMLTNSIGSMYTPAFSSHDYVEYLADNFGVVKQAQAAPATGFEGLQPIIGLWRATRDIAYFMLVIAFIFIGVGVMLRIRIDPRTVMTIQNQIPRVIICIILITFSYAFAAVMIDTMWAVTYMGINKLTQETNPRSATCLPPNITTQTLNQAATNNILQTPFAFVNQVFSPIVCAELGGIPTLSLIVGNNLASLEWGVLLEALGIRTVGCTSGAPLPVNTVNIVVDIAAIFNGGGNSITDIAGCLIGNAFAHVFQFFAGIAWALIVLIVLIITLFRLWFELLRAYVMILIYVIAAPLWIVMGLLPKRPLGFERWLRVYFANLAVFPATVFLIVAARVFYEKFGTNTSNIFIPPLVGNPAAPGFGAVLAFAMLLMAPTILSILREKLGTPPLKQFGQAMQVFNAGRAAAGKPAQALWKGVNRRNPQTGAGEAFVSRLKDKAGQKISLGVSNMVKDVGPLAKPAKQTAERQHMRAEGHGLRTYNEVYGADSRANPNNRPAVTKIDNALNNAPRNRSREDINHLAQKENLLTDGQKQQLRNERIEISIQMPGGQPAQQLAVPRGQTARAFVLSRATPGGQAAMEREWDASHNTADGQRLSSTPTQGLAAEDFNDIEAFLNQQAAAGRVQPPPPPPATP